MTATYRQRIQRERLTPEPQRQTEWRVRPTRFFLDKNDWNVYFDNSADDGFLNPSQSSPIDENNIGLKIKTKTKKGVDEMKSKHVMSEFIPGTKVCFNPEHTDYQTFLDHLNNITTGIVLKSYNDSQVSVIFRTSNERVQSLNVNISALLIIDEPLTKVLKYIIDNKSFFTLSAKEENELLEKIVKERLLVSSVKAYN